MEKGQDRNLCTWKNWICVLVAFIILYGFTAQRSVSWQDSGEFQWRVLNFDLVGKMGLARAHPLYIAVGHLFTFLGRENLPLYLNIFSGIGMAVALANLAIILWRLTGNLRAGLCVVGMLGVSHAVWWLSTIAEVYTWSVAGLTAEILLLLMLLDKPCRKNFMLLAFASGLGLCVHNFALLPLPVYLVVAIYLTRKKLLGAQDWLYAVCCWMLGGGMYLGLTFGLMMQTGDVFGAIKSALVGDFGGAVFNVSGLSKHFMANAALSALSFLNILLPLAVFGWIRLGRQVGRSKAVCLWVITGIHALFFIRYPVPDQFTFILPTMVMISIGAGVGLNQLPSGKSGFRTGIVVVCILCIVGQPVILGSLPGAIRQWNPEAGQTRHPYRNEIRYWVVPWKHNEDSALKFAREELKKVPNKLWLLPCSTRVFPLLLVQELENLRKDVDILSELK